MKVVFWGKGKRGRLCLKKILQCSEVDVIAAVLHPESEVKDGDLRELASDLETVFCPENPNNINFHKSLKALDADVFILGGYGKILKQNTINIAVKKCINLHGGRLPQYRGSSPLNWALINGDSEFGISIIEVDAGVDTGDVLLEKSFPIDTDTSIKDLHDIANEHFPEMLVAVLKQIQEDSLSPRKQNEDQACYYPRRFSEDGMILFDMLGAEEIHNRIRALTVPYPCAYSYLDGKKVLLVESQLDYENFRGEPGRIYRKRKGSFLIGTKEGCLWIKKAIFAEDELEVYPSVRNYDCLATASILFEKMMQGN